MRIPPVARGRHLLILEGPSPLPLWRPGTGPRELPVCARRITRHTGSQCDITCFQPSYPRDSQCPSTGLGYPIPRCCIFGQSRPLALITHQQRSYPDTLRTWPRDRARGCGGGNRTHFARVMSPVCTRSTSPQQDYRRSLPKGKRARAATNSPSSWPVPGPLPAWTSRRPASGPYRRSLGTVAVWYHWPVWPWGSAPRS